MTKAINPDRLAQLQCLARAVEQTEDSVLITDRDGVIQFVNRGFERVTGYARAEVVGKTPALLKSGAHDVRFYRRLWQTILSGRVFRELFTNRRKDNELYREAKTITPVKDEAGQITHFISTGKDLSERLRIEEQLRDSEERFRQVTENIHEVFWLTTPDKDQMLYISPAYEAIWGRSCESLYAEPRSWLTAIHPDDRARVLHAALTDQAGGRYAVEYRILQPDGSQRWISDRAFPIRDAQGEVYRIAGVAEDITESHNARAALCTSEAYLRAIIETEPECVKLLGPDGALLQMNAAGLAMIEADEFQQVDGKSVYPLIKAEYREAFRALTECVLAGGKGTLEFEIVGLKGTPRWLEMHAVPFKSATDDQAQLLSITHDITERKNSEERLSYLADYDPLTELPNRTLFNDRLQQALIEAKRHDRLVGMALLDLDDFKKINDTLGHVTGDELLRAVGARLATAVRPGDTVARLAGDEFAFVLADMARADHAALVAEKILSAFSAPFIVAQHEFHMSACLGLALYPLDETNGEGLLRAADTAMYRAKARGAGNYQFYTPEMTARARERLAIESDLRHALERNQLTLHYQPLVDARSGATIGAEALLRWVHPTLGSVPPLNFIPVAEATGLIVPIGHWVIETACAQAAAWTRQGLPPLTMAVNVSARQFLENDLVGTVRHALETSGLDARRLHVEITESTLMQFSDDVIANLRALGELGVEIAIDDFGMDYSSFKYLKRFRAQILKIDRSFVQTVTDSSNDFAIVKAMYSVADSLGMTVVAEGVETAAQAETLHTLGCQVLQGYYFGKPQPAEEFAAGLHVA
jgi:diguanylate cyclase (GGDEF)-like protein/PAS domain S-box-containing protein